MEGKILKWREWLAQQRAQSRLSVERISLKDVRGWVNHEGVKFGRPDGKFFNLIGVRITNADREVINWDQPLLEEVGQRFIILIQAQGEERYLIAAKAEPGNATRPGYVLLAPPLQTSESNLERVHGGKCPPRTDLLGRGDIKWVELTLDGGRFMSKVNRYAVILIDPATVNLAQNERWFTREELREAFFEGELNEHLCLALLASVL